MIRYIIEENKYLVLRFTCFIRSEFQLYNRKLQTFKQSIILVISDNSRR